MLMRGRGCVAPLQMVFHTVIISLMLLPLTNKSFVNQEFGLLDLGDKRLNKRALKVAGMINETPSLSFPDAAVGNKAELKAFYRFFQNEKISDQKLMKCHYNNTINRMNECSNDILLINDTMFVSPAKSKSMDGLKDMGKGKGNGIRIHYMIAVDALTGDTLGITDLRILGESLGKTNITLKDESDLWKLVAKTTVKRIKDILTKKEAKRLIKRCTFEGDREADDYDLFLHLLLDLELNFIIRSQYDRKLTDKEYEGKYNITEFEDKEIQHGSPYQIKVLEKGKIRIATVQRSVLKSYELHPPQNQSKKETITISIVFVKEVDPPKSVTPIKWRLLTSNNIGNSKDSEAVVTAYIKRWKIEELNKCSKTGVKLEERQFTKVEHLWPAIAIIMIISWRILYIRDLANHDEDINAATVFNEEEMDLLKLAIPEKKNITVKDSLEYIAQLGGFLGTYERPGWIILWRGWFKFVFMVKGVAMTRKTR